MTPQPNFSQGTISVNGKNLDTVYVNDEESFSIEGKDLTNEEFITIFRTKSQIDLSRDEIMGLPNKLRTKIIALAAIESL